MPYFFPIFPFEVGTAKATRPDSRLLPEGCGTILIQGKLEGPPGASRHFPTNTNSFSRVPGILDRSVHGDPFSRSKPVGGD